MNLFFVSSSVCSPRQGPIQMTCARAKVFSVQCSMYCTITTTAIVNNNKPNQQRKRTHTHTRSEQIIKYSEIQARDNRYGMCLCMRRISRVMGTYAVTRCFQTFYSSTRIFLFFFIFFSFTLALIYEAVVWSSRKTRTPAQHWKCSESDSYSYSQSEHFDSGV